MDALTAPQDRAITKLGIGLVLSLLEALQRGHSTRAESAPHGYFLKIFYDREMIRGNFMILGNRRKTAVISAVGRPQVLSQK